MQNVYISLPYIMAARTAGIDRSEEVTSLSPYYLSTSPFLSLFRFTFFHLFFPLLFFSMYRWGFCLAVWWPW